MCPNPLGLKNAKKKTKSLPIGSSKLKLSPKTFKEKFSKKNIKRALNPKNWHFNWKKFLIGLAIFFAVIVVLSTAVFAYYVKDLPNPKEISRRNVVQATQILDRNGVALYNFHGEENRTVVKGDQISDYAKKATIAVEDQYFYQHHGFDLTGIMRAIRNRITGKGLTGGGSTITQQYIKNTLLTREETIDRKLRELILSMEVEQLYSKDEILTGYLNEIPYGNNAYGIEAAAKTYFNKSAKDLTLSESATLAGMPQAPTYYSPYGSNVEKLFIRKDYILDRMAKVGSISQEEADKAKTEAPTLENPSFKQQDLTAPHFVFYVREKLIDIITEENKIDRQEAELKLDQSGYTVTTSLDSNTQTLAQNIMSEMGPDMVKKYQATNGSLTAVDPKTGEILAMVGSISYNNSKSGNTNFANALLQPGSSFKPFIYATAFGPNNKYAPSSITYDLPTDFGNYKPNNYNGKFSGPITNRNALAQSLNIPAVKNFYLAGVKDSIATAQKMGITSLNRDASEYGLSLVLGSGEVRPVEMAGAYATFGNEGMTNPLRPILKIEKNGSVIKDYTKTEAVKTIEPEVAYEISSILSDNAARTPVFGSKSNLTLPDRPVAAKSGSTENNRDAWTVGYTPSISVAVWVGNNDANKTMTKGADGSYVAGPIWNRFMREYLKGKPVEQFKRPSTITEVTVDKLSGKLPSDQSPKDQLITDIFAPWQVPTEQDNVHVKIKIDKVSGKIATDLTPADQIEERYYINIHSEVPSNPGWENPVRQWALANGASEFIPTEKDDVHTDSNKPIISFTSPKDGGQVNGTFRIEVSPGGSQAITSVEFFVNNVSIGKRTEAPWAIEYDSASLTLGTQTISATVTNALGLTNSAQINISQNSDKTPPTNVNYSPATDGALISNQPIKLYWTNPSNSDLSSVNIYQSSTNGILGSKVKNVVATPGTQGSTTIDVSGLTPGTYYFTIRGLDLAGNENQTVEQVQAKVI